MLVLNHLRRENMEDVDKLEVVVEGDEEVEEEVTKQT